MQESFAAKVRSTIPPHIRGGLYYAVHFAVVSIYFSYVSVAFIERGLTGVQLGTMSSIGSIVTLFASPILTGIADRKGWHIPFVSIGNILFGISVLLINYAPNFAILALIGAVGAFVKAPTNPIGDGLMIRMTNKHHLDFGSMRIWGSISFTIFCISAGWLWDTIGLEKLFWVGGFLFILRALMGLILESVSDSEPTTAAINRNKLPKGDWLSPFKDKLFTIYLIGMILWGCSMNGFFGYISIYINQLASSTFLVGIAVALPAITEMPSLLYGDRVLRKIGMLPTLMIGIAMLVTVSFIVSFTYDPVLLIILNSIRGLGFGFWIVVGVRYVDSRAPEDKVAQYQAINTLAIYSIPTLFFSPLLGYIYDTLGVNSTFVISGGMGVITLLLLAYLQWKTKQDEKLQAQNSTS
jgi:PPP family 3-phenylpropionic acid transporter